MGSCTVGFTAKGRTEAAVRKEIKVRFEESRDRYGSDPYSGALHNLGTVKFLSTVFESDDAFEAFIENKSKYDGGYAAQVKTATDTATITRWCAELNAQVRTNWKLVEGSKERKAGDKKVEALRTKIKTTRAKRTAASKKTVWVVGGWVAE